MSKSKKYQDFLIDQLKDHDEVVVYLNAALEESLKVTKNPNKYF